MATWVKSVLRQPGWFLAFLGLACCCLAVLAMHHALYSWPAVALTVMPREVLSDFNEQNHVASQEQLPVHENKVSKSKRSETKESLPQNGPHVGNGYKKSNKQHKVQNQMDILKRDSVVNKMYPVGLESVPELNLGYGKVGRYDDLQDSEKPGKTGLASLRNVTDNRQSNQLKYKNGSNFGGVSKQSRRLSTRSTEKTEDQHQRLNRSQGVDNDSVSFPKVQVSDTQIIKVRIRTNSGRKSNFSSDDAEHEKIIRGTFKIFKGINTTSHKGGPSLLEAHIDGVGMGSFDSTYDPSTTRVLRRRMFRHSKLDPTPSWSSGLYFNWTDPPELFMNWSDSRKGMCGGRFTGYANEFALLRDVVIDKRFCSCYLKGGEYVEDILMQLEEEEYYRYNMGCFRMQCSLSNRPSYYFNGNNHLTQWMDSLATRGGSKLQEPIMHSEFTIAVTRYEYANIYHTMTDWYNAFLVMQYFNQTPSTTNILIMDSHPYSTLDSVWTQLFNSTFRLSSLPPLTNFSNLVWGILGYNSPMTSYLTDIEPPLYEEFREFFLSGYSIAPSAHILACSNISVLFIWRHDYIAHPRNPNGTVARKIHNEKELIRYVQKRNPQYRVVGKQIDLLPMREQLALITRANVLVGMHGAGLTHAVFLPKKAAVLELVPMYAMLPGDHFLAIAAWRGLVYDMWQNEDETLEFWDQSTVVPPKVVNGMIRRAVGKLCRVRGTKRSRKFEQV